jgi:PAS domain S-box-containing protein
MIATILVVEDNPITRKMLRVALAAEGYRVLEASDGQTALALMAAHAPDLVLQDLLLPDMDGFGLVEQLRAVPGGAAVPILAISGYLTQVEQARSQRVGFTDYLFKPVEPSNLIRTIQAYLGPVGTTSGKAGRGWRVLVVDDDAVQLKLLRVELQHLGFEVLTAADGMEALDLARRCRPDAIVSDVLMPRMDGFRLCLAVRQDPQLAHVKVVLTSAVYIEEADQFLARNVGADAFTLRTPDHRGTAEALLASLGRNSLPGASGLCDPLAGALGLGGSLAGASDTCPSPEVPEGPPVELPLEDYTHRIIRQLEHQVGLSAGLTRRLALLEAELGILARILETIKSTTAAEVVLGELLHRCLDAAGISRGAAYLLDPRGELTLEVRLGYPESLAGSLTQFFGHGALLRRVLEQGEPLEVSAARPDDDGCRDLLDRAGARSILLTPLVWGEKRLGVLEMASANRDLGQDWVAFAKGIGNQIGQALELARTIAELNASEQRYRDLVQGLDAIVWEADAQTGRFTFVSWGAEKLLGHPVECWLRDADFRTFLLHPDDRDAATALYRRMIAEGCGQTLEYRLVAADERVLRFQDTVSVVRDAGGRVRQLRGVMADVTRRRQAEEQEMKLCVAREIYQTLFPRAAPAVAGFEVGGASYPAEATGGDYFDYFLLPDGSLAVAIGDASGHGYGPAILMAQTRASLRALAQTGMDVAAIAECLDRILGEGNTESHFVTLLLARLDPQSRRLDYVNAGHTEGLVLDPAGTIRATLDGTCPPLGIGAEPAGHRSRTVALAPGDTVVLLTDGIVEARSPEGAAFGVQRALDIVRAYRGDSPRQIVTNLFHAVRAFARNLPQQDDVTGVVLKVQATA